MAFLFNGATHVLRRSDAVLQTWPLTMFCWARLPSVDSTEHCLIAIHETGANNGFRLVLSFTGGSMKARMGTKAAGANNNATSTTSVSDTNWHSVTGEVTAAAARQVWLDNGGNGSSATSMSPGTMVKTLIGATEDSGTLSTNVNHQIAHAAVWQAALTADERAALHAGFSPLLIRPQSLRMYAPLIREPVELLASAFTVTGATVVDNPRALAA